jgi:hypothetical protein
MKKLILTLAATFASGLLFVNVYTSLVDAPNWGRDIPNSLLAARAYMSAANPGTFFRIFSPANQIIALLALIICWRSGKRVRIYCAIALGLAVGGALFTFAYFYPRNAIMFTQPLTTDTELLKQTWSQWTTMNWPRSAILVVEVIVDYLALMHICQNRER